MHARALLLFSLACSTADPAAGGPARVGAQPPTPPSKVAVSPAGLAEDAPCRPIEKVDYPDVVIDWRPPCDAAGTVVSAGGIQYAMDVYAWRGFLARSWPVDAQGALDPAQPPGVGADRRALWETWSATADLFPSDGSAPGPWGSPPPLPAACAALGPNPQPQRRLLRYTTKIEMLASEGPHKTSDFGLLANEVIDGQGYPVYYEVRLDRAAWDYVLSAGLDTRAGQEGKTASFPAGCATATGGELGATVIKAAWMRLSAAQDKADFHSAEVYLYDPRTDRCEAATVGLVGLHMATRSQQAPLWAWATFEHRANAPDITEQPLQGQWSFLDPSAVDPSCYTVPRGAACAWNEPPQARPLGERRQPTQVVRALPLTQQSTRSTDARSVNQQAWDALEALQPGNRWGRYVLVGTQWSCPAGVTVAGCPSGAPVTPTPPPNAAVCPLPPVVSSPTPPVLANGVMETYHQGSSDCVGCHSAAQMAAGGGADFMFFLSQAR